MLDPNGRHRFETERPRRLDATVAGDDHLRLVDEDRICKAKFANRGRDLVDLLLRVNARVVRKRFQQVDRAFLDAEVIEPCDRHGRRHGGESGHHSTSARVPAVVTCRVGHGYFPVEQNDETP
jgi:hypothetical protein